MNIITQVINTIQGEGINSGVPMTLVRFGNCNLNCKYCDTKWSNNITDEVIQKRPKSIKRLPEFPNIITEDNKLQYLEHIKTFTNKTGKLLFTGGEPLLNQKLIIDIIEYVKPKAIEIETNGTIFPEFQKYNIPVTINISPKLDTECYTNIELYNNLGESSTKFINSNLNWIMNWKFIWYRKMEDEINKFIKQVGIDENKVTIMPLTPFSKNYDSKRRFLESYKHKCLETLRFCITNKYRFSPRFQVWLFDNHDEIIY